MKTYDKPQHIYVTETVQQTQRSFDRDAYCTAVIAEVGDVPALLTTEIERGRFDDDPVLLAHMVPALCSRVLAGEFHPAQTVDVEVGHWEWVDPLDERVDATIRELAAAERAAKEAAPAE